MADRKPNKAALQQRFGLAPDADALLFAVISRMAWQKGLDLLADAVPALVARGAQLAVLGTGDPELGATASRHWRKSTAARSDASSATTKIWRT